MNRDLLTFRRSRVSGEIYADLDARTIAVITPDMCLAVWDEFTQEWDEIWQGENVKDCYTALKDFLATSNYLKVMA